MSGRFRTNLGRDRARAQLHCEEYEASIAANPPPWNIRKRAIFDVFHAKLTKDREKLQNEWKKWDDLVDSLEEQTDVDAEVALIDEWMRKEEFVKTSEDLDDHIVEIESYMKAPWAVDVEAVAPSIADSLVKDEGLGRSTLKFDHVSWQCKSNVKSLLSNAGLTPAEGCARHSCPPGLVVTYKEKASENQPAAAEIERVREKFVAEPEQPHKEAGHGEEEEIIVIHDLKEAVGKAQEKSEEIVAQSEQFIGNDTAEATSDIREHRPSLEDVAADENHGEHVQLSVVGDPTEAVAATVMSEAVPVNIDEEEPEPKFAAAKKGSCGSNAAGREYLFEKYGIGVEQLDRFWNVWSKNYFFLRERKKRNKHKNARGTATIYSIAMEYVMISEAGHPRAKVVECVESRNGDTQFAESEESVTTVNASDNDIVFPFVNCNCEINQ